MNRIAGLGLLLALVAAAATPLLAQDCPEPDPAQMMAAQQKMMALMGPGPEHELLSMLAGEWNGKVLMWFQPGMDPVESSLEATHELVLGGRFLHTTAKGSMMEMPVESLGYMGFDRRHEHYTMIGFDTLGTYSISAAGTYDDESKKLLLSGTDDDPLAGITQVYDFEIEVIDENTHVLRLIFHCPSFGTDGPFKLMETTYSRKQG